MSDQTTNCPCEPVKPVLVPLTGLGLDVSVLGDLGGLSREEVIQIVRDEMGSSGNTRMWESDWFAVSASGTQTVTHDLGLESPWKCTPKVVTKVETPAAGWQTGEIIFSDGTNYVGAGSSAELGWAIAISENEAHMSFGNSPNHIANARGGGFGFLPKANVKCKLVIEY